MEIQFFNQDKLNRAKIAVAVDEGKVKADASNSEKLKAAEAIAEDSEVLIKQYLKLGGYATKDGAEIPFEKWEEFKLEKEAKPQIVKSSKKKKK